MMRGKRAVDDECAAILKTPKILSREFSDKSKV
jgi:hypothetical protein